MQATAQVTTEKGRPVTPEKQRGVSKKTGVAQSGGPSLCACVCDPLPPPPPHLDWKPTLKLLKGDSTADVMRSWLLLAAVASSS